MQIDWSSVFIPSLGIAEVIVRGTLMYLGLFVVLRFMARRQAGTRTVRSNRRTGRGLT